jgi:hypothetical protein
LVVEPLDVRVLEVELDVLREDELLDLVEDPELALAGAPAGEPAGAPAAAGAPPAAWAARLATVLRRALTCAELAAMAFCSATTCGSSDAAGAAVVELPVVEVTGW